MNGIAIFMKMNLSAIVHSKFILLRCWLFSDDKQSEKCLKSNICNGRREQYNVMQTSNNASKISWSPMVVCSFLKFCRHWRVGNFWGESNCIMRYSIQIASRTNALFRYVHVYLFSIANTLIDIKLLNFHGINIK